MGRCVDVTCPNVRVPLGETFCPAVNNRYYPVVASLTDELAFLIS